MEVPHPKFDKTSSTEKYVVKSIDASQITNSIEGPLKQESLKMIIKKVNDVKADSKILEKGTKSKSFVRRNLNFTKKRPTTSKIDCPDEKKAKTITSTLKYKSDEAPLYNEAYMDSEFIYPKLDLLEETMDKADKCYTARVKLPLSDAKSERPKRHCTTRSTMLTECFEVFAHTDELADEFSTVNSIADKSEIKAGNVGKKEKKIVKGELASADPPLALSTVDMSFSSVPLLQLSSKETAATPSIDESKFDNELDAGAELVEAKDNTVIDEAAFPIRDQWKWNLSDELHSNSPMPKWKSIFNIPNNSAPVSSGRPNTATSFKTHQTREQKELLQRVKARQEVDNAKIKEENEKAAKYKSYRSKTAAQQKCFTTSQKRILRMLRINNKEMRKIMMSS